MKTENIFLVLMMIFLSFSCTDFDDLNSNPDTINKGQADMLATGILKHFNPGYAMKTHLAQKQIVWTEGGECHEQYNKWGRTGFGMYTILKDAQKMEEAALINDPDNKSYVALNHFVRAYHFYYLSMWVGDIPYTDALKGESEGLFDIKYDTQKDVMLNVLAELEKADLLFSEANNFSGDFIYGGDVAKWRKLVNSFELKVLMSLSKKVDDKDLNIKDRFNSIVANKPIFTSNDDNFQLIYQDKEGLKYPFHRHSHVQYPHLSALLVNKLKTLKDNRLFYFAEPASKMIADGELDSSFDAYLGASVVETNANIALYAANGIVSHINDRYASPTNPEGEPGVLFDYAQLEFILAEACLKNWINQTAATHYENGIKASMNFYKTFVDDQWVHGMPITEQYVNDYLAQNDVVLSANQEEAIQQIIWQKYLSSFLLKNWDVYIDYRRTKYPEFPIDENTNMNSQKDRIPVRWMYPESEFRYNKKNVEEAVDRQYGGNDEPNEIMWVLK